MTTTIHCAEVAPEIERLRAEVARLREERDALRASRPGDYVVTYAHPDEALRAEVEALRALVGELREAVRETTAALAARNHASARGYARAAALTPERRREIASAASRARWARLRATPQDVLEDSQPLDVSEEDASL